MIVRLVIFVFLINFITCIHTIEDFQSYGSEIHQANRYFHLTWIKENNLTLSYEKNVFDQYYHCSTFDK